MSYDPKHLPAMPLLLTADQVAEQWGVTVATVRKWTYQRLIPSVHLRGGRAVRYRSSDILRLIEKWERAARQPLQERDP